ncbi:MAG: lysine--tRNA ligase, partial [Alphaproteobacteria bacterium]
MAIDRELVQAAKAWPFQEARSIVERLGGADASHTPDKGYVLFETGYGPSGLPHIGTFGEVARTTMVRNAFMAMSDIPTRLIAFSDDMDGLRKVPENVPEQEMLTEHLGKPLTAVPDPFGTHDSFGAHNNARLQAFLDTFGFDYEFRSSTVAYRAGEFDATLLKMLAHYGDVMKVILPTLGEERQATYSPFLPICPRTGVVLQVPMEKVDPEAGTIVYRDPETGEAIETPVTGGACKLQWKADWAMRWVALSVDYEMSGKDLIDSVNLSGRICRILGAKPPVGLTYELFLDDNGEKISKSRGNGLTIEDWLTYGPPESLSQFMFAKPKTAKRLFFDVIPKSVDEYLTHVSRYPAQEPDQQLQNPAWHIHTGDVPAAGADLSFGVLLNLAGACNSEDPAVLWGFI